MSRLSKNIIYNLFGQGLLLVLGFVAVRYIFRQLGEDALGIIYFTAVMNALLCAVLEMGICSTTVREVAVHFESEPEYIQDLIRTASLFYWGASALLGLVIYFMAPFLVEKWINLKIMDSATAIYVIRILGIASLVALPKSFYASLFRGIQRMEFNNFIDVTTSGLQQFGTILILILGGNLFHVVYWFATCYGLRIFTYIAVSTRFFPLRSFVPAYSLGVVKRNYSFASRMMFISITAAVHSQIDKAIISKLLPIGTLGYYSIAYSSVSKGTLLAGAVSQAAFPSFSALFKAENRTGLMSQYNKLQDLVCFGIVPVFAAVPFALLPLFSYILNEDAARLLFLPTTLLCVGFYLNGTLHVPYVFSLAVGKPEITARQHFYDLFFTVPATIVLVYYLNLVGASLSLVLFYTFHYSYSVPKVCSTCLRIPTWKWYLHVFKVFVLISLTYGPAWAIVKGVNINSVGYLALSYLLSSVIFLVGAYFIISDELRESLLKHSQSFRRVLINGF